MRGTIVITLPETFIGWVAIIPASVPMPVMPRAILPLAVGFKSARIIIFLKELLAIKTGEIEIPMSDGLVHSHCVELPITAPVS